MLETRLMGIENQLSLLNNTSNHQISAPRDLVPVPPVDAAELIVDQSGEHEQAYTTIQAAIDAANPNDKILVYPGNYEESLIINIPVHIEGIGARYLNSSSMPLNLL